MRKEFLWPLAIVAVLLVIIITGVGLINLPEKATTILEDKKIAIIHIDGEIFDSLGVLTLLHNYEEMKSIKAIVIRLNSPGGAVGSSQEIYSQLIKMKKNDIKIIASMDDTAASGAYYIAAAADKIYANPGTVTGSIGVIISYMNAEKLMDKVGISFVTIKSGEFKDVGSMSRPSTEREKAMLNSMIRQVLGQFIDAIVDVRVAQLAKAANIKVKDEKLRRKLVREYVASRIADGRIMSGQEAYELGLVDELGNIDDAIEGAAKLIGLKGRPNVVSVRKRQGFSAWINSKVDEITMKSLRDDTGFKLKFLLR